MSKTQGEDMYSHLSRDGLQEMLHKSQNRVAQLTESERQLKMRLDLATKKLATCEQKAQHFDILIGAVKENELVRSQWDKFMMALRMTGYDGTR